MGMPVAELLSRISARELTEWRAFFSIEPPPDQRLEVYMAQLTAVLAEIHRDRKARKDPFSIADFHLFQDVATAEPDTETKAKKFAAMLGAPD